MQNELIIVNEYCEKCHIEPSFIDLLQDNGLIDVLIEENGKLYPVEIKRTTTPNVGDIKNFRVIEDVLHAQRGPGAVVCNAQTHLPLTADVNVIPVAYL